MDEHAQRVCAPLLATWHVFLDEGATLLDLARLAAQASNALDNASAPLPQMLHEAAADLEYAFYANERHQHLASGRRILGPLLTHLRT